MRQGGQGKLQFDDEPCHRPGSLERVDLLGFILELEVMNLRWASIIIGFTILFGSCGDTKPESGRKTAAKPIMVGEFKKRAKVFDLNDGPKFLARIELMKTEGQTSSGCAQAIEDRIKFSPCDARNMDQVFEIQYDEKHTGLYQISSTTYGKCFTAVYAPSPSPLHTISLSECSPSSNEQFFDVHTNPYTPPPFWLKEQLKGVTLQSLAGKKLFLSLNFDQSTTLTDNARYLMFKPDNSYSIETLSSTAVSIKTSETITNSSIETNTLTNTDSKTKSTAPTNPFTPATAQAYAQSCPYGNVFFTKVQARDTELQDLGYTFADGGGWYANESDVTDLQAILRTDPKLQNLKPSKETEAGITVYRCEIVSSFFPGKTIIVIHRPPPWEVDDE